ncbi:MAG TPA: hydrogenase 4 subunit D [Longimicrobiales bacterium]|nr:hydrogenase 4 subunit D [Longimicrobiales bacterium]
MLTAALAMVIVLPVLGAVSTRFLAPRGVRGTAVAASLAAALMACWAVWAGWATLGVGNRAALFDMAWLPGTSGSGLFGVLLDPLAAVLLLVVTVIGFLTVLYSTSYLREGNRDHAVGPEGQARYYFWLLAFMASMAGVALAPNFLQLFVFWELTTVCSWALISYYRSEKSLRAGFKALLMTHSGGIFFLLAILILFAKTGSFDFDAPSRLDGSLRFWVYGFLMVAAWAKAAQLPFHTWLPDAMEAPTPISAYLHAASMVKAGVFLMARAVSGGWAMPPELGALLAVMALVTVLVALSFYFVQDDLKRLLAYSTIAHLGYVLLGVAMGAMGSQVGFQGGVLHILCHGFGKATLFMCAGAVAYATGTRSISALSGLAKTMPLTAAAFFVGVLAVTGIPPFSCFWSKFMILAGAMRVPGPLGPTILVLLLAESLVAFGWMLHVGQKVFFGAPTEAALMAKDPPGTMKWTLVALMAGSLLVPLVGIPLVHMIGG